MTLNKTQRETIRMMFGGRCAYCGCELPEKGWHADHVEPVYREWWKSHKWWKDRQYKYDFDEATGRLNRTPIPYSPAGMERPANDRIENLFPSCRACNIDKNASTLEGWRQQLQDRANVCRRNYSAFRHAERFGLVVVIDKPIVFWFEKYAAAAG